MDHGFVSGAGDFAAISTLIATIGAILRDSTGSSADYQELILRFDCFEQLLKTVLHQLTSSQLPPSVVSAIKAHVSRCEPILRKFDTATEMYRRDEILELHDGLGRQMDAIQLLLSCCTAETARTTPGEKPPTFSLDLAPWAPDYKPIRFIDALDCRLLLPFESFRNFKVFQNMMKNHFDGRPGSCWVNAGLYEIMDESARIPLTIQNWDDTIVPDGSRETCPSCGVLHKPYGKCKDLERVQCLNCRTWFQISLEPRILEVSEDCSSTHKESLATSSTSYIEELRLIRRFKVLINEEVQYERSVSPLSEENNQQNPDGVISPSPAGTSPQGRVEQSALPLLGEVYTEETGLDDHSQQGSIIYSIVGDVADGAKNLFTYCDSKYDDTDNDDSQSTGSASSIGSLISYRSEGTSNTALSVHIQANTSLVNEAVEVIAETLSRSKIRPYVQHAVEYIHDDLFMDNHVRFLRDYAQDLRQEATSEVEKQACEIIRSRYKSIGRAILSHFQPQTRPPVSSRNLHAHAAKFLSRQEKTELLLSKEGYATDSHPVENDDDDNNDDDCEVIGPRLIEETKQFLVSSRAFEKLFIAIRDRVHLKLGSKHLLILNDMVEQRRDSENKDDGHNDKFVLIPGILDDAFENDLPHEPAKDKNYSVHSRIELIEIDCEIGVNTNDVGQKCTAAEGAYGEPRLHHDNRQSIIQIMDNIVTSSDREEERPVSSEQIIAQNQKSGSAVLHDEEYEQSNSVDTRVDADVQGYISRFQVFIEDAFRMHISWWPLPAPQRETMGKAGWKQIWWKCKCGNQFIKWVPATPTPTPTPTPTAAGQNYNTPSIPSPARVTSTRVSGNTSSGIGALPASMQAAGNTTNSLFPNNSGFPHFSQPTKDYVLLVAESPFKSCHALGWIVLPPPDKRLDSDFFRHLKKEYHRLRRWDQAIFTFRAFCYFKFVKFEHFAKGPKRIFCYPQQEIPCRINTDYHTKAAQTNPPIPPPPIHPALMNHFYKYPECADDTTENLELIPKRMNGPLPNTERVGWGLQAVEGPNGFLIICVVLLLLGIAGWFVSWWNHRHPDDPQSATIVFTLLFPVLTLLATAPRYMWARVWDEEEGRLSY